MRMVLIPDDYDDCVADVVIKKDDSVLAIYRQLKVEDVDSWMLDSQTFKAKLETLDDTLIPIRYLENCDVAGKKIEELMEEYDMSLSAMYGGDIVNWILDEWNDDWFKRKWYKERYLNERL